MSMLHIYLLVHIAGITTIIKDIKFGKSSNKEKQGTLNINKKHTNITHEIENLFQMAFILKKIEKSLRYDIFMSIF